MDAVIRSAMRKTSNIFSRRLLALVIILAVGVRSLIPAGFMPDFSAHNPFALMVCDGVHHHHSSDGKQDRTEVCSFSVGAVFGFDGIKIPAVVPPAYTVASAIFGRLYAVTQSGAFSNASPRSPPVFS